MPNPKRKNALGRGLGSLMGEAQSETGFNDVKENQLNIDQIKPNPNQPRTNFKPDELQELANSIKEHGVIQPLIVRKVSNYYQIIAGERRYQASKLAGLTEVPVVIKDVDDQKVLELALIENLQRSDLNPIEEARGYKQLIQKSGMTQEALSKAVSKSRSTITNSLRLLDLPEEVQQLLFDGLITAGHARAILAVPYEDKRIKLAQKVVDEGLSVRATEKLAPLFSVDSDIERPKSVTPQSYKRAALVLRQVFDTPVKVKQLRGKNKIEIEFKDEEQLSRILEAIVRTDDDHE